VTSTQARNPTRTAASGGRALREDVSMLLFELLIAGIALAGAGLLSLAR
jgi:hypothetical protein